MVHDRGFQERRAQYEHGDRAIMIRVAQLQHGRSFLRLAWDPGITLFSNSTTDTKESRCYFQEFTTRVHGIGFLEEQFSEELTEFLQYLIALLTDSIQEAPRASTLQDSALIRGCFTSSRLVWDPGITLSFNLVQLVDRMVEVALLEDKQSLGREDCNVPIFGFPYYATGVTSGGLSQPGQRGENRSSVSLEGLEEFYGAQLSLFTIIHHQNQFHIACSWFHCIPTIPVKRGYYWA
jgi:hypothetical protein